MRVVSNGLEVTQFFPNLLVLTIPAWVWRMHIIYADLATLSRLRRLILQSEPIWTISICSFGMSIISLFGEKQIQTHFFSPRPRQGTQCAVPGFDISLLKANRSPKAGFSSRAPSGLPVKQGPVPQLPEAWIQPVPAAMGLGLPKWRWIETVRPLAAGAHRLAHAAAPWPADPGARGPCR